MYFAGASIYALDPVVPACAPAPGVAAALASIACVLGLLAAIKELEGAVGKAES